MANRNFASLWCISTLLATSLASTTPAQVLNTLAYHQLSVFDTPILDGGAGAPILSRDGQHIAFARPQIPGDLASRIFVVSFDGTGQTEVDSYPNCCFSLWLDISADGSKVASTNGGELHIANGDGSGALVLLALASGQFSGIAVSADGSQVFFQANSDTFVRNSDPPDPIERGVWVINADGSGRQQLVSPAQMEALGIPSNPSFGGNSDPPVLAASGDASQIVFAAFNDPQPGGFGQGLFAVTVGNTVLRNGLDDPDVAHQIMSDIGGGVLTNGNVVTDCGAVVGRRTVRVQAGVLSGDNRRHASAVEFGPFAVVDDAPIRRQ